MTDTQYPKPKTPEESLLAMQGIVNAFYRAAVFTNCHAFLEFAGIMEEFLKVCRHNLERGIDFRDCHEHSGIELHLEPWHLNYINQKLRCIFGGRLSVQWVDTKNDGEVIPK